MTIPEYTWKIESVNFHVFKGSIFDCPVEAIVNSEQTDFRLARRGASISAQIFQRFGQDTQEQLDRQTDGTTLTAGTVLRTTTDTYRQIYHAGFHEPQDWALGEGHYARHVDAIRVCIREILDDFLRGPLRSIAFPLIGCGNFGLDQRILAYEFALAVVQAVRSTDPRHLSEEKSVWLALLDAEDRQRSFRELIQDIGQSFLDVHQGRPLGAPLAVGVDYLDRFELIAMRAGFPWNLWQMLRYSELVASFMFYHLAIDRDHGRGPEQMFPQKFISFGAVVRAAKELAARPLVESESEWTTLFAALFGAEEQTWKRLVASRNDVAHGRHLATLEDVRKDIASCVRVERWQELVMHVEPGLHRLEPWLICPKDGARVTEVAVIDTWANNKRVYLVPSTGRRILPEDQA